MRVLRFLPVFLVVPVLLAADEKKSPPTGWKEFTPKNKNYITWVPEDGKMKESENSIILKKGGQVRIFRAVFERNNGSLFITSEIRLPPALGMGPAKGRHDLLRDLCLDEFDGKLLEEKQIKLGTMGGREYLIKTPKGRLRFRLLGTGVLIYRQVVVGTKEQVESKDTDTFMDSFQRTDSFIKKNQPKKE